MWKRVIDSQAEKLKELDKEIRPFRQSWEEAGSMKSSVESLQSRVTELESVDKSAGQAARNTGESRAGPGGPGTGEPGRVPGPQARAGVGEPRAALGRRSPVTAGASDAPPAGAAGFLPRCPQQGPRRSPPCRRAAWQSGRGAACGSGAPDPLLKAWGTEGDQRQQGTRRAQQRVRYLEATGATASRAERVF